LSPDENELDELTEEGLHDDELEELDELLEDGDGLGDELDDELGDSDGLEEDEDELDEIIDIDLPPRFLD